VAIAVPIVGTDHSGITEPELRREFLASVEHIPGGRRISRCLQCGTCTGSCPVAYAMDLSPREVIARFRAGDIKGVLESRSIWLCASCYACTVNCPAGIHITDVMYALKRMAIKEGTTPKRFPVSVLAKQFLRGVTRTGRSNEFDVGVGLAMRTNPLRLLKMTPLGLKLLKTRRLRVRGEKVRDPQALDDLLRRVHEATR